MVGDIGVEIKKKSRSARACGAVDPICELPQIARLIVLAPRGVDLPKSIGGKTRDDDEP